MAQQRPGLHRLQAADLRRVQRPAERLEPTLGGKIQHLPADHAAKPGRAREAAYQIEPQGGVGIGLRPRKEIEGEREQGIAGQNRGRLVEGLVDGGAAAPDVVVVHRRQVVMDQRIAVDAFGRRGGQQEVAGPVVDVAAEQPGGLDGEEGAQPLAPAEHRVAHRVQQARGAQDLALLRRLIKQRRKARVHEGAVSARRSSKARRSMACPLTPPP
ncbi:hypothetical protein A6302_00122 [Methylobrevis pamukkalensis]|uniref:Uncharacterized protein n=1 Tax=Methylobrevis pamukkalensis TaxID=1439726 RepID=A0A1E3H8G5_9HYPH|nr:hypothetical protein A6302_00122 [Methylobrevis pamukkalensis]